jgi:hypothetical protein
MTDNAASQLEQPPLKLNLEESEAVPFHQKELMSLKSPPRIANAQAYRSCSRSVDRDWGAALAVGDPSAGLSSDT